MGGATAPPQSGSAGLASPVPDAGAQTMPTALAVFDEPCDKTFTSPGATTPTSYAEHAFPGKIAAQLATVAVLVSFSSPLEIPGYGLLSGAPQIRDGAVGVTCSGSARFVVP